MFVDGGVVGSCATAISVVARREHKIAVLMSMYRYLPLGRRVRICLTPKVWHGGDCYLFIVFLESDAC
jgi:hypothetical protein